VAVNIIIFWKTKHRTQMESKLMVHIYQNTRRHNAESYYQAKSGSAAHKIPFHLLNSKVPHFVPIVSQMHPIHTLPTFVFNPLKPELNPICYLLALLAHHFLHVSRKRVKSL